MPQNVLILDTSRQEVESLREIMEKQGHDVMAAYGTNEAVRRLRDKTFHALIVGPRIVAEMGQTVFAQIQPEASGATRLVLLEPGSREDVSAAAARFGYHILRHPVSPAAIAEVLARQGAISAAIPGGAGSSGPLDPPEILGESPAMRRLRETLLAVARTDATVLLRGETGSGKELAARFIHFHSSRSRERLVAVNCAALSESLLESELFGHEKGAFTGAHRQKPGKFEYAGKGTLFLDEIGEMAPHLQAKMLRVVDDRKFERVGGNRALAVECRIVAASNVDFSKALSAGRFREDLYHRLNVVSIQLPSLRERPEDIPLLARRLLRRFADKYAQPVGDPPPHFLERLASYSWPGNVRELENAIERSVILARDGRLQDPPLPVDGARETAPGLPVQYPAEDLTLREMRKRVLAQCEKTYFERLLLTHKGHVSRAAQAAGVDRKTFYRGLREYGIVPARFKKKRLPFK